MAAITCAHVEVHLDARLLRNYMFYSAILIVKLLMMTVLTIRQRFLKKVFSSPEDATYRKVVIKYDDPDVERVRRAHRNDIENIPVFVILAFLYICTKPNADLASRLFQLYTASRILHTLVYTIIVLPQPARVITFFMGYFVLVYMALTVLMYSY